MSFSRANVPMPSTPAEYAALYRENLQEAQRKLRDALDRVARLRDAKSIIDEEVKDRPGEYQTVCVGKIAQQAWGDFVRWNSDCEHWQTRLKEASSPGFESLIKPVRGGKPVNPEDAWLEPAFATDPRLPPENDAEDTDVPF